MNKAKYLFLVMIAVLILGLIWFFSEPNNLQTSVTHEHSHSHQHSHNGGHAHDEETEVHLNDEQIKKQNIKIEKASPGTLSSVLTTRGKIILHPDRLVHVSPKVAGVANAARKNVGDPVKENEVLAIIESNEMAELNANYLSVVEKEQLTKNLLQREQQLFQKKISPEQDYFNAKANDEEAVINVQLARQKLQSYGLTENEIDHLDATYRLYEIRSPIDGVVIKRHLTKGEHINTTDLIYELANLDEVWVEIGVFPKDLNTIKKNQLVTVYLPGENKTAEAKIFYVSPIIGEETINSKALALLPNPEQEWLPGSFVNVDIALSKINSPVVISKDALQTIEGSDVVFVKLPDGFEKRVVKTGKSDKNQIEIISGLAAGEEFAASHTFILKADLSKGSAEHTH